MTEADVARLFEELRTHRAILEQLLARQGVQDGRDVDLFVRIANAVAGESFTAKDVMDHAKAQPDLQTAMEAADVETPRELADAFRRLEGVPIAGLVLTRGQKIARGRAWSIRAL